MSSYAKTRAAALALRNALHPRRRAPKGKTAVAFGEDRRKIRSLLSDPNVLGFGVTEKVVDGKSVAGEFSVTFYVRRKLRSDRLRRESIVPRRLRIHSLESAIQTDVQPLGGMHVAHAGVTSGSSIGHISGTAGSVSFIAADASSGEKLILSCSHVLARAGLAQAGDQIESPAFSQNGNPPQVVGSLTNRFMVIDPQTFNTLDAALAEPSAGIALLNNIPGLGTLVGIQDLTQTGGQSAINLSVSKFGAATSLQSGQITGMHATLQIRFPELGDQVVWFTDLITHSIPSTEGDSGAAVVEPTAMNVVAMHIASAGPSGLCTNIQPVLDMLQVGLWDGS